QVGTTVLQRVHQCAQSVARERVVGVEEGQVRTARQAHAPVAHRTESAVLLVDELDALVLCGESGCDLGGGIGAAVVDEDDLQVLQGLVDHAREACLQVGGHVVDGDEDREQRAVLRRLGRSAGGRAGGKAGGSAGRSAGGCGQVGRGRGPASAQDG